MAASLAGQRCWRQLALASAPRMVMRSRFKYWKVMRCRRSGRWPCDLLNKVVVAVIEQRQAEAAGARRLRSRAQLPLVSSLRSGLAMVW